MQEVFFKPDFRNILEITQKQFIQGFFSDRVGYFIMSRLNRNLTPDILLRDL